MTLIVIQRITLKYISQKKWASETIYLQLHTHVRNAFLALITISVVTIWIPQIQSFALSIAAIAVAIVVSLKELITMLTGGFVRTSADIMSVGDRIEINGIRGDVIRAGFFTTDLLEVGDCGQRTGRIIYVPNSFFYTAPVINEAAVKSFTFHVLTFPVAIDKYSPSLRQELLDFTKELTKDYLEKAASEFKKFTRKNAMTSLNVEPRLLVKPYSYEEYHLVLRVPIPITEKIHLEQKIIEKYTILISKAGEKLKKG